jgi:hypothetical protein
VVNVNGNIYSGKNITDATWDPGTGRWTVYFTEGAYNVYDHVTMITPLGLQPEGPPLTVSYDQGGPNNDANAMAIGIYDSRTGQPVMKSFSIIVLPPE